MYIYLDRQMRLSRRELTVRKHKANGYLTLGIAWER